MSLPRFDGPIRLKPADAPADVTGLVIELADAVRMLVDETIQARDLHTRATMAHDARLASRVQSRLIELHESAGRADEIVERLSRAIRAGGRL